MVVEGQEWLFNAATTGLSLDGPFDDQRDGLFPARSGGSQPGYAFARHLCPALPVGRASSGHRGGRSTGPLRKCVGKIPFESLRLS